MSDERKIDALTGQPEHEAIARARSDLVETAQTVRIKCLLGMVDSRTGEIQRKTAIDVLDKLEQVTDESLLAEVERRAKRLTAAAKKG